MCRQGAGVVAALVILMAGAGAVHAGALQVGLSAEPLDISGGGFFLDVSMDLPLAEVKSASLSLRPTFSVGPLPLHISFFVVDAFGVLCLPLRGLTLFAGVGPGMVFSTAWRSLSWSVVTIAGVEDITILGDLRVYFQFKVRGAGFFLSPGFGVEFTW
jgi:disulfide bond formation protein DsbB